jgi:hypothetical protein
MDLGADKDHNDDSEKLLLKGLPSDHTRGRTTSNGLYKPKGRKAVFSVRQTSSERRSLKVKNRFIPSEDEIAKNDEDYEFNQE